MLGRLCSDARKRNTQYLRQVNELFKDEKVRIDPLFAYSATDAKDFIETLAHEMVHLYQMTWLKDPYSNHNKNFFAWKNKFKYAGLNLSRC